VLRLKTILCSAAEMGVKVTQIRGRIDRDVMSILRMRNESRGNENVFSFKVSIHCIEISSFVNMGNERNTNVVK